MRPCALLLIVPLLAAPVRAQDVASGPDVGVKVPALKVADVTGMHKEKDVDYASERKDKLTVYLFVQADKFSRPMNRFVKGLEDLVKKDYEDAYVIAVWLAEDVDKTKERLAAVQMSMKYEATALTVFAGDKAGPKDWGVNADAHLTAVVANKGKVAATFGYQSVNETDVAKVKEALAKAREKK